LRCHTNMHALLDFFLSQILSIPNDVGQIYHIIPVSKQTKQNLL